jgi:LysM repeat protein
MGLRVAAYALAAALVLVAVWLARSNSDNTASAAIPAPLATDAPAAAATANSNSPAIAAPLSVPDSGSDITRLAALHTTIPTRADYSVKEYIVVANDTLFVIATKFNLKPATILWGNPELADNPNILSVGKKVNILPVDGALRVVMPGDTLEKIAKVFHGKIDDIVKFPGNDLDPVDPQIQKGQQLVIPGGWRDQVEWTLPAPPSRQVAGRGWSPEPGACPGPFSGANGTGTYAWPANNHYLSGWNFHDPGNPSHQGIDISARLGAPIYAADSGVIVFAGVSLVGYGNLIVIDHGNGNQTAYGHLSQINVVCGQSVYQGNLIGLAGSTGNSSGPHLHFEIRSDQYGRVNPFSYLP